MKELVRIVAVLLGLSASLHAAVVYVPSMSQADMQAASAAAHDGDLFIFPAGTASYTSSVNWTNAVTLRFVPGQSIIYPPSDGCSVALTFGGHTGTNLLRITGLTINGQGHGGGMYFYASECTAIRVDHCAFVECGYTGAAPGPCSAGWSFPRAMYIKGYRMYGVVDHCSFTNCSTFFDLVGGDYLSWHFDVDPYGLGTTNCMVVEDNYFYRDSVSTTVADACFYFGTQGSRLLFRHNTCQINGFVGLFADLHGNNNLASVLGDAFASHGTIFGVFENNIINCNFARQEGQGFADPRMFYVRGGCFIAISNIVSDPNNTWYVPFSLTDEECWYWSAGNPNFGQDWSTWPRQDQITNSWFVNNIRNGSLMTSQDVSLWDGGVNNSYVQVCIQQGRDYWVSNSIPAANYKPLVYPHPLVTTGASRRNYSPVIFARAIPSTGAIPLPVSFSSSGSYNPDGTALTYLWNFGDGVLSTVANPSHTFATNGVFKVQLAISDGIKTVTTNLTITATQ